MREAVIPVHLSGALLQGASDDAQRRGMTLETWLLSLAAEHMLDRVATERFFGRKAQDGDGERMLEILNSTRDNAPIPGDEL